MPFETMLLQGPLFDVWNAIASALPRIMAAAVILVFGIVVAAVFRRVVEKIIALLRLDEAAARFELKAQCERVGIRLHIGKLFGWMVKWFFLIVALIAATDVLGWGEVTDYLKRVVLFVPNVLIAVVILLAGILLGQMIQRVVRTAGDAAQLHSAAFLSGLAKWAIVVFSFMAALVQLNIAQDLIRVLFTGLVFMVSLAGGLAFGLGGKTHAAELLDRLKKDVTSPSSHDGV